jgi:hypothetical protein
VLLEAGVSQGKKNEALVQAVGDRNLDIVAVEARRTLRDLKSVLAKSEVRRHVDDGRAGMELRTLFASCARAAFLGAVFAIVAVLACVALITSRARGAWMNFGRTAR